MKTITELVLIAIVSLVLFFLWLFAGIWKLILFLSIAGGICLVYYFYQRKRLVVAKVGSNEKATNVLEEKPKTTLKDVAGIDEVKEEVEEIIDFIRNEEKYTRIGARIPKGVLLIGPPGVGKTLLARAIAGEAGIPVLSHGGSKFVNTYVGVGANTIRNLFKRARNISPCIIFIDEIDAIGQRSGDSTESSGEKEYDQTINALLEEMDGFEVLNGVIVIAATNRVGKLDEALKRPGRFDRTIFVNKPDVKGREEILKVHTRKLVLSDDVDLKIIASSLPGVSGADLSNIANEAAIRAAGMDRDKVFREDFEYAKDKVTLGKENKSLSSVLSDEEKRTTAIHEAGHAIVAHFTPNGDPINKISIIPRGNALGITSLIPDKDRYNQSREHLMDNLAMLYGGRAAEKLAIGTITAGAQNDIERATMIATKMVCEFGMGEDDTPIYYLRDEGFNGLNISEEAKKGIDLEVKNILDEAMRTANLILEDKRELLSKLAGELIKRETLNGDEVIQILGEPTK